MSLELSFFTQNYKKKNWSYVVHLINKMPILVLNNKTSFEMLYDKSPTFMDLKVFGCLAYASTNLQNKTKLDNCARKCIFLGY